MADWKKTRETHYERFFGPIETVVHPVESKVPHIDVYQFAPHGNRDHWTLITGGMSDLRQPGAPDDVSPRAEIVMYARTPEPWMLDVLKGLAEYPVAAGSYLHWYHSAPNGQPMTTTPSRLTAFFFRPPDEEVDEFGTLEIDGDPVDILWLVPITDGELEYKLEHGGDALVKLLAERGIGPIVDESRESAAEASGVVQDGFDPTALVLLQRRFVLPTPDQMEARACEAWVDRFGLNEDGVPFLYTSHTGAELGSYLMHAHGNAFLTSVLPRGERNMPDPEELDSDELENAWDSYEATTVVNQAYVVEPGSPQNLMYITTLVAELIDDDTLALYHPATSRIWPIERSLPRQLRMTPGMFFMSQ